jgi:hypothetical protein
MTKKDHTSVGRPSSFNESVAEIIIRLATEGLTDLEIAENIGISDRTLRLWKGKHPELLPALKEAKSVADDLVEASLFQQAMAGNTTAAIFWLKNRRPKEWRDVQRLEHTGRDGGPVLIAPLTDDQIEQAIGKLLETDEGGGFE